MEGGAAGHCEVRVERVASRSWNDNNYGSSRPHCEREQRPMGLNRPMAAPAGSSSRRTSDWRSLSPGTCVEDPRGDRLDTTTACQASHGAESGEGKTLGRSKMAPGKENARRRKAWIFFQDESGGSQRPSIRRTSAPKGETPVLVHAFNWSTISVCAAMGFRWDGRRSQLFFSDP
jgi:hypothetical protein